MIINRTLFYSLLMLLVSFSFITQAIAANPKVAIETNKGTITVELFADKAPLTVENFLRYVKAGKYDSTLFHRVVKNYVIMGGGYDHNHKRRDTFEPVKNEADNGLKNLRGTLAMTHGKDPHSAMNQFFINLKDNPELNHKNKTPQGWGFAVFGKVIDGMEVVDRISRVSTMTLLPLGPAAPKFPVSIRKITVLEE